MLIDNPFIFFIIKVKQIWLLIFFLSIIIILWDKIDSYILSEHSLYYVCMV